MNSGFPNRFSPEVLQIDFAVLAAPGRDKTLLQTTLSTALIHEPRLIILDEPLTGLYAGSARQVKTVLSGLVAQGVSIIMKTHILEVAERMADRIGIIARGKLVAEGTLEELRERASADGNSLEDIFLEIVGGEPEGEAPASKANSLYEKVA